MGFWSGVGDFFEEYGDDILVGAVSVAGFAVGGPIGAAVAGGIAGGIAAGVQGENIAMGAGFGALGGIVGGVGSFGVKGVVGAGKSLAAAQAKNAAAATGDAAAKAAAKKMALNRGALGWLPTKIGAAHLPPGRTYLGLVGAGGAPSMGNYLEDSFRKNVLGYPAIPVIDISDEDADWPEGQSHVFMPDPENLPHDLEFTSPMQQNYRTLVPTYKGLRLNFGDSSRENALPKEMDVSDVSGEEASGIPNYVETVAALREEYSRLRSGSEIVANAAQRTSDLCKAGRSDMNSSVDALKSFAETDPRDLEQIKQLADGLREKPNENTGQPFLDVDPEQIDIVKGSEDLYAMILISAAIVGAEVIVSAYGQAFQSLATEAEQAAAKKRSTDRTSTEKKKTGAEQTEKPGTSVDPSYRPTTTQVRPGTENPATSVPTTTQAPPALDLDGTDATGTEKATDSAASGRTDADRPGSGSPAGSDVAGRPGTAATAVPVPAAVTGSAGAGSGFESMMLAPLVSAMMNGRGSAGTSGKRRDGDDHHDQQGNTTVSAAPAPAPANQPGASPASPAAQPGTQPSPAKTVSAPVKPVTPPPTNAVAKSPEGNVVYTFPDGRTQEVSVVVAGVLDAAFGNASATDARQAYEGSVAAWTDVKRIGARVDPYQLMTGDIGVWEERAAVLAVIDEAADGRLEAVIDGALQAVASLAEMRDGAGEFGRFTGFFHPPGIEKAAAAQPGAAPAELPSDQSAAVPA